MVFLLDGSERMGLENHRRAKEFIENVARRLNLANSNSDERDARIALLQYGSPTEQRVEFPLTYNLTLISDSLANVNYMDSSSALGSAIIHAVNNIVIPRVQRDRYLLVDVRVLSMSSQKCLNTFNVVFLARRPTGSSPCRVGLHLHHRWNHIQGAAG